MERVRTWSSARKLAPYVFVAPFWYLHRVPVIPTNLCRRDQPRQVRGHRRSRIHRPPELPEGPLQPIPRHLFNNTIFYTLGTLLVLIRSR